MLTPRSVCRHEINAPTGFERSVPINAVQFYTAQARGSKWLLLLRHALLLTRCIFWFLSGAARAGRAAQQRIRVSVRTALQACASIRRLTASPIVSDLKPENILMDGNGNLKLADLGFAKLVFEGGRAYTVCGTPDYLAPEVIEHRGATRGSDYWALGILIFEFISG